MSEVIIETKGVAHKVTLYDNRIEYEPIGLFRWGNVSDGLKVIPLKSITGIRFMKDCYIQFFFPGSLETKKGILFHQEDDPRIMFNKKDNEDFEKIKDYICEKM